MFKKALIGIASASLVTGTIVAASFNGETTIGNIKSFMEEVSITLNTFKGNETVLASKIVELKALRDTLTEQVNDLTTLNSNMAKEKEQLLSQIATLEQTIKDLEEQLANSGNNEELVAENERLTGELNKANLEIEKANELVASLQTVLDNMKVPNPMTDEELNNLLDLEQPGGEYPPLTEGEKDSATKIFYREGNYTWNGNSITVDRLEDDSVKIDVTLSDQSINGYLFFENGNVEEFTGNLATTTMNKVRMIQVNDTVDSMTLIAINNN
ncbi:MAG: hypothetical protein ACRCX2_10015 [Paraclostridium sp.]